MISEPRMSEMSKRISFAIAAAEGLTDCVGWAPDGSDACGGLGLGLNVAMRTIEQVSMMSLERHCIYAAYKEGRRGGGALARSPSWRCSSSTECNLLANTANETGPSLTCSAPQPYICSAYRYLIWNTPYRPHRKYCSSAHIQDSPKIGDAQRARSQAASCSNLSACGHRECR